MQIIKSNAAYNLFNLILKIMTEIFTQDIVIDTNHIIHDKDCHDITFDEFISQIDYKFIRNYIRENIMPIDDGTLYIILTTAFRNREVPTWYKAVKHIDTYQTDNNQWRVQLAINLKLCPKAVCFALYKKDKHKYIVSFNGEDSILLTFTIPSNKN